MKIIKTIALLLILSSPAHASIVFFAVDSQYQWGDNTHQAKIIKAQHGIQQFQISASPCDTVTSGCDSAYHAELPINLDYANPGIMTNALVNSQVVHPTITMYSDVNSSDDSHRWDLYNNTLASCLCSPSAGDLQGASYNVQAFEADGSASVNPKANLN